MNILARLRMMFLLLAAFLVASCAREAVPLNGTVTDAYTGQPIVAASISLGSQNLTTDSSGAFSIKRWTTKDVLQVQANGYEPTSIELATQPALEKPTPPAVNLDTKLRPNTLHGVITDAYTGKPLADVQVKASDTISATTGADGSYVLNDVPEQVTLTISGARYETLSHTIDRLVTYDTTLRPNTLEGILKNSYTGEPIAGATVKAGDASATSDDSGHYVLENVPERTTVSFTADGYADLSQPIDKQIALDATLRPDVLKATLVDATTNKPIPNATILASPNVGSSDVAFTRIDSSADGTFELDGLPEQGVIQVLAPGYKKAVIEIKAGSIEPTIKLEPFLAKALYVTAAVASRPELLNEYLDMIDRTELNAIVIDLKSDLRDDLGLVYYDSQVPLVKELGTSRPYMDLAAILAETKKRGIYTIARIHIFSHDNALADARPDWAAKDRKTGEVFADYPGPNIRYAWLDPWNENVWDYNIQLSVEAAQMGFDEINYDYIRFPSLEFAADDKDRLQLSREGTSEEKFQNIANVLERSQRAINGAGAFLSVDVFGYVAWQPMGLIGQSVASMAPHTDYICPMIYPSHFVPGELGFDNPAAHPYEIIAASMERGFKQIDGQRAHLRPWLQEFTLVWVPKDQIVEYGPKEVRAQIQAVEDSGQPSGWILYDSANDYNEDALKPEK